MSDPEASSRHAPRPGAALGDGPLDWVQVLEEELAVLPGGPGRDHLEGARNAFNAHWQSLGAGTDPDAIKAAKDRAWLEVLVDLAHRSRTAALCLSGGGIRSATFALGVLQGFARGGVLDSFDYLSTVSGGGYLGAWYKAWQARSATDPVPEEAIVNLAGRLPEDPYRESDKLRKPLGAGPEARQVRWLRSFSNYLSPRLGALSADTWTLLTLVGRNLLVHWAVLLPMLGALLLVPHLALWAIAQPWSLPLTRSIFALACALALVGFYESWNFTPNPGRTHPEAPGQTRVLLLAVAPLALAAGLFAFLAGSLHAAPGGSSWAWTLTQPWRFSALMGTLHLTGWLAHAIRTNVRQPRLLLQEGVLALGLGLLGGWAAARILAALLPTPFQPIQLATYLILAPSALLLIFSVGGCFLMAFGTSLHGPDGRSWLPEGEEEWLARFWAWLALIGFIWATLAVIPLLGPYVLQLAWSGFAIMGTGLLGILNALLAGRSGESRGESEPSLKGWFLSKGATLGGWAFAFALVFFLGLGLSAGLVRLRHPSRAPAPVAASAVVTFQLNLDLDAPVQNLSLNRTAPSRETAWMMRAVALHRQTLEDDVKHQAFLPSMAWLAVLIPLAVALLVSLWVDLSRFSGQGLYTRRLIRAYLGASHLRRRPDPFTGFDEKDDLPVADLAPDQRPFPVINLTLNLVRADRLAWQERKAERFTVSPLHCGARRLGYRDARRYGGGLSLGVAVGLSGAAVNSNMGYHDSRVVAFLMTLFNVRLGAWLGNPGSPGARSWDQVHPRFYPLLLLREAAGLTDQGHRWVNLSDGGHFENLGLYEMVVRRCRFIVVVDAGADGGYTEEDLAMALRKIRIDFGIPVVFPEPLKPGKPIRLAVGEIDYGAVDLDEKGAPALPGTLLYLKAALMGDEPADVAAFARANPGFPHQSTGDQFFSESQFESYRHLGEFTAKGALEHLQTLSRPTGPGGPGVHEQDPGPPPDQGASFTQVIRPGSGAISA